MIYLIQIKRPTLLEQTAIAEILSDMDAEITALEEAVQEAGGQGGEDVRAVNGEGEINVVSLRGKRSDRSNFLALGDCFAILRLRGERSTQDGSQ